MYISWFDLGTNIISSTLFLMTRKSFFFFFYLHERFSLFVTKLKSRKKLKNTRRSRVAEVLLYDRFTYSSTNLYLYIHTRRFYTSSLFENTNYETCLRGAKMTNCVLSVCELLLRVLFAARRFSPNGPPADGGGGVHRNPDRNHLTRVQP